MPSRATKSVDVLSAGKVRKDAESFLLEGWRHLDEALKAGAEIERVIVEEGRSLTSIAESVVREVRARSIPLTPATGKKLKKLTSSVHAQGVVAAVRKKEQTFDELLALRPPIILALDGVSDPGNFGTLLRTSEWFGVTGVLASAACVNMYNEKVLRSAVGSLLHLQVIQNLDLVGALRRLHAEGYKTYALDADGDLDYRHVRFPAKSVIVAGNEAYGITPEVRSIADSTLRIPRVGKSESLNVAVAAGIVLAHIRLNA